MSGASRTLGQERFKEAVGLFQAGRLEEAATIFKDILRQNPDSFDVNHLTGVTMFRLGLHDQAQKMLKLAVKINPKSAQALTNLGSVQAALGEHKEALLSFNKALIAEPANYQAHFKKGNTLQTLRRTEESLESYAEAKKLQDKDPMLYNNMGAALRDLGRFDEAISAFDHAITLLPQSVNAYINKGNTLQDAARYDEAVECYDKALSIAPDHPDALINKGKALQEKESFDDALACYDRVLALAPKNKDAFSLRGIVLMEMKRPDEAMESIQTALRLQNDNPAAVTANARALMEAGKHEEALVEFDHALSLDPDNARTHAFRAALLNKMERPLEAIAGYDRSLTIWPGFADAHVKRALVLQMLKKYDEAIAGFKRTLELAPNSLTAYMNLGNLYQYRGEHETAVEYYDKALKIDKKNAGTLYNRAQALSTLKHNKETNTDLDKAHAPNSRPRNLVGSRIYAKMLLSDWSVCHEIPAFLQKVHDGEYEARPFILIGLPASAESQMACAINHAKKAHPPLEPLWTGQKYSHDRIRIGYLSADLHRHATAYLMAGMFEQHDRNAFETYAYSIGHDDKSDLRARLVSSFDHFHDVASKSDDEIARLVLEHEIDILVDLKGYTRDSRLNILACRPAPVQVAYIGYPGTSGAPYIDYFVADRRTITPEIEPFFTEKIIYLPDSYQVNDDKRYQPPENPKRADYGLPEDAFVFCSFNNNYKIMPETFDIWMRLLKQVDNSVFWMFEGNAEVGKNLKKEAKKRGVDPARLFFAPKLKLEEHLARQACADLFLDSLPCNAHTTASDALWVGLPLLTCMGDTFTGRVAGSLLHALGMPELITHNRADYEAKALELARSPQKLAAIRQKMIAQRSTAPLFDTTKSTRHLESAYKIIWEKHQKGESPATFDVPSSD